jgi:hypothetical protein
MATTRSEQTPESADDGVDIVSLTERSDLSEWLGSEASGGKVGHTKLRASDRVIARVTDGIYRQPASAIRELISNAWDADAKNVTILTDAPRFSRIYVRDDGVGMSHETLARMLHNIGGSAKRSKEGSALGITSTSDPDRTPGGRLLIGKIGIGLFSVSQLARRFRIVTKTSGTNYRLVADVHLRTYSEEDSQEDTEDSQDDSDDYISGNVYLRREATSDVSAHGTDIIIDELKPRVRDVLRDADRWRAIDDAAQINITTDKSDAIARRQILEPRYHSGWIANLSNDGGAPSVLTRSPHLPWSVKDSPSKRMLRLVDAVEGEFSRTERPDLAATLDTYLETIWTLGLMAPVAYVDKHPFDITGASPIRLFWLSNEPRGQAKELTFLPTKTVREAVRDQVANSPWLEDGLDDGLGGFRVEIDGVELRRPIRFDYTRIDKRGLDKALLFVGKYSPQLERVSEGQRGGALSLEGYLFWNGRIVPKENNGVLVRIRGASGALFDPSFFKYQVSEQTRLRQITSELFIKRGLDAALNIDRESFNFSHPHVQLVSIWLHRALRQLTNRHKDLSQQARIERLAIEAISMQDAASRIGVESWTRRRGDDPIPDIAFVSNDASAMESRRQGSIAFSRDQVPALALPEGAERSRREARARAIVLLLDAYDVLSDRSYLEQSELLGALLSVVYAPA